MNEYYSLLLKKKKSQPNWLFYFLVILYQLISQLFLIQVFNLISSGLFFYA